MLQKRWTIKEQATLLSRLGTLLQRGYSLSAAIDFILIQFEINSLKYNQLTQCVNYLKDGESLSHVLSRLNFHNLVIGFVFCSEKNGELAQSLQSASFLLQKRMNDQMKIKRLLSYPLFLLIFTCLMFGIFQWTLLPQFHELYQSFQAEPSRFILVLLWFNDHPYHLIVIISISACVIGCILTCLKRTNTKYEIQILVCKLPAIGKLVRLMNTYYIAFQISQLLKNGVSLLDSLQFLKNDPSQGYLSETMSIINRDLMAGETFYVAVARIPVWQKELAAVIQHGQLSGRLDNELETYSELCFEQFSERVDQLSRWLQPIIFSLIGIWIVLLYISIMMPSFQMINNL